MSLTATSPQRHVRRSQRGSGEGGTAPRVMGTVELVLPRCTEYSKRATAPMPRGRCKSRQHPNKTMTNGANERRPTHATYVAWVLGYALPERR
ncbi:hypothetical protein K443DRAFT_15251 [Laccaria amethystina LaAM-08-1]|uniref:Uncharacterized protein n=1 Tax=Laccaria amethystina LaAM-08-1 TaxID=1095629 RepID=A0A0C9WLM7_9AGAR|nr:hypothetical protein K443DRAFT_15251 [Laccaria amethystina LaAM-08-1]